MIMLSQIDQAVCAKYNIPPTALKGDNRERRVARPRQVACYIGRQLTTYSLPQIGLWYGNRDHTTILHACRKVESLMRESPAFAGEVASLKDEIAGSKSRFKTEARRLGAVLGGAEFVLDLEQTG